MFMAAPCYCGGKDDFKAAEELWETFNFEESMQLYNKALLTNDLSNDERVAAHYNNALALFFTAKIKSSIKEINKLLKINDNHVAAYGLRANCWIELGRMKGEDNNHLAFADWATALALDPDDAITYNDRGYYYEENGQLDKAIKDIEKYLELEPESPPQKAFLKRMKCEKNRNFLK